MQILLPCISKELPCVHSPLTIINPSFPIGFMESSNDISTNAAECDYHFGFEFK